MFCYTRLWRSVNFELDVKNTNSNVLSEELIHSNIINNEII